MMRLTAILFLAIILSSCIDLGFENPQPEGLSNVDGLPAELSGSYINKDDTLVFSSGFIISGGDSVSLIPSETLVIRKYNGYYFINMTDEKKGYWTVTCAKINKDRLTLMIPELQEDDKEQLEKKWPVKEKYNEYDELMAYIISPTKNEWKKLLRSKYYAKNTFKRID